jgi:hypothetical protein
MTPSKIILGYYLDYFLVKRLLYMYVYREEYVCCKDFNGDSIRDGFKYFVFEHSEYQPRSKMTSQWT